MLIGPIGHMNSLYNVYSIHRSNGAHQSNIHACGCGFFGFFTYLFHSKKEVYAIEPPRIDNDAFYME